MVDWAKFGQAILNLKYEDRHQEHLDTILSDTIWSEEIPYEEDFWTALGEYLVNGKQ